MLPLISQRHGRVERFRERRGRYAGHWLKTPHTPA
jgi:hypothetical protein